MTARLRRAAAWRGAEPAAELSGVRDQPVTIHRRTPPMADDVEYIVTRPDRGDGQWHAAAAGEDRCLCGVAIGPRWHAESPAGALRKSVTCQRCDGKLVRRRRKGGGA